MRASVKIPFAMCMQVDIRCGQRKSCFTPPQHWPIFSKSHIWNINIVEAVRAIQKSVSYEIYRIWYLKWNDTIVNVVIGDIDLHFLGRTLYCYAFPISKSIGYWIQICLDSPWTCFCYTNRLPPKTRENNNKNNQKGKDNQQFNSPRWYWIAVMTVSQSASN